MGHGSGDFTAQYFRGWDRGSFHDSNELTQRRCEEEKGNLPSIQSQPTIYTKRVKKKKKKKKKTRKTRKTRKKRKKKRRKKRKKKKRKKKEEEEEEKKGEVHGLVAVNLISITQQCGL